MREETLVEFIPVAAMAVLVAKLIDLFRYASAKDVNGVATQIAVWVAGVVVVALVAQTAWAAGIMVGTYPLTKLGFWSQVFYGMSIGSAGSLVKDGLKAVDNKQTAAIPTLLPSRSAPPTE